ASVEAIFRADKEVVSAWRHQGMAKVVLKVADEKELIKMMQEAKDAGLTTALITDAGKTVVAPGTRTCLAIGPASSDELNMHFSELKLY
ncbi:peptidyl-tRNA hydrolase, partial [Candidatus Woesearchaeota archaeon]|nr:peptidyl-tRNA hydrolase [Candidatus Woesearchaeota archaeon]